MQRNIIAVEHRKSRMHTNEQTNDRTQCTIQQKTFRNDGLLLNQQTPVSGRVAMMSNHFSIA